MGEVLPILRPARRQGKPAVTGDHCGDPVPGRGGAQRIPKDLGIVVSVQIDESGSDDQVRCVDRPPGTTSDFSHSSYLPVHNSYIPPKPRGASAVHNGAVFNE